MRDSDNYAAHATRCRQEADAAILDNVRERSLRAEAAWAAMADRSRKTEQSRDAAKPARWPMPPRRCSGPPTPRADERAESPPTGGLRRAAGT
jgi:hypothetical protein